MFQKENLNKTKMENNKKSNWAIEDDSGNIIKRGFKYKTTAIRDIQIHQTHKREKLQVVRDD